MENTKEPREICLQITFEEDDIQRVERITDRKIETKEDLYDTILTALNIYDSSIIENNILTIKEFFMSDKWSNDDFERFTDIPISARILESDIMRHIEDTLSQISNEELQKFANEFKEKLNSTAESIPTSPLANCEIKIWKNNENMCVFTIDDSVSDSFDLNQYLGLSIDIDEYSTIKGVYHKNNNILGIRAFVESDDNCYDRRIELNLTDTNYIIEQVIKLTKEMEK